MEDTLLLIGKMQIKKCRILYAARRRINSYSHILLNWNSVEIRARLYRRKIVHLLVAPLTYIFNELPFQNDIHI